MKPFGFRTGGGHDAVCSVPIAAKRYSSVCGSLGRLDAVRDMVRFGSWRLRSRSTSNCCAVLPSTGCPTTLRPNVQASRAAEPRFTTSGCQLWACFGSVRNSKIFLGRRFDLNGCLVHIATLRQPAAAFTAFFDGHPPATGE